MKTHPVLYVGRLKRYTDPEEIQYPHRSNVTDGDVVYESSVVAGEATETANSFPLTSDYHLAMDLESEENSAFDAGLSSPASTTSPSKASGGHTSDGPSHSHRAAQKSVARLDSRGRTPNVAKQHPLSASAQRQDTQPRKGWRNRCSYRVPQVLVDADENARFLVGKMLTHRFVKQKLQILV